MLTFTRAHAGSSDVLCVIAGRADAEAYEPSDLAYQYRHRADLDEGVRWYVERFDFSVQGVTLFVPPDGTDSYFVLLSSEGDVYHFAPDRYEERIQGAGTTEPDSKFYGKTLAITQIGERLYVDLPAGGGGLLVHYAAARSKAMGLM